MTTLAFWFVSRIALKTRSASARPHSNRHRGCPGFLPLAHLDPRVALPVIRQELAHANSFKQAGFGTWDSMGSVLRLRALESLQRPTLAGLRVFMVPAHILLESAFPFIDVNACGAMHCNSNIIFPFIWACTEQGKQWLGHHTARGMVWHARGQAMVF